MDKKVFTENMENLFILFEKDMNEKLAVAYWNVLKGMPNDEFKAQCRRIIKTERFFPRVSCFFSESDRVEQIAAELRGKK